MVIPILATIFVLLVVFIILREYKNEKKYQSGRYQSPKKKEPEDLKKEAEAQKKALEEEIKQKKEAAHKEIARREEASKAEEAQKQMAQDQAKQAEEQKRQALLEEAQKEAQNIQEQAKQEQEKLTQAQVVTPPAPAKDLPACEYPPFSHIRLVEMGLSDDEAVEFVAELVPQLEEQIPLIKETLDANDFHKTERLTHGVKGSATNIGTGGVSDLLVEWNTYLKSGDDIDVAKAYFEAYIIYTEKLKVQYS